MTTVPRAVTAFLVLPGLVAYAIPVVLAPSGRGPGAWWQLAGLGLVATGTFVLSWCAREFYVAGKGTLAPWSPPQELVVTGPFRWSRNPMYVSVVLVLIGWAGWYASATLLVYTFAVAVAFYLRVVFYEEPRLQQLFRGQWRTYSSRTPRWLGVVRTTR